MGRRKRRAVQVPWCLPRQHFGRDQKTNYPLVLLERHRAFLYNLLVFNRLQIRHSQEMYKLLLKTMLRPSAVDIEPGEPGNYLVITSMDLYNTYLD